MADQITELLQKCENTGLGCIAGDEEALRSMLFIDDAGVRANYDQIAIGADKAATDNLPLEEGSYTTVELNVTAGGIGTLEDGEVGAIKEILQDPRSETEFTVENVAARIARCAYVCGGVGVGGCPIKTPQ